MNRKGNGIYFSIRLVPSHKMYKSSIMLLFSHLMYLLTEGVISFVIYNRRLVNIWALFSIDCRKILDIREIFWNSVYDFWVFILSRLYWKKKLAFEIVICSFRKRKTIVSKRYRNLWNEAKSKSRTGNHFFMRST